MNFDGQGGYFYVLVAKRGVDFNPIYISGCKNLNFGLFEVWKKVQSSIFIGNQNWDIGSLEVFQRSLGGLLKKPNQRFLLSSCQPGKIKSLAGSEQKLQIWPFGHILVFINGYKWRFRTI